MQICSVFPGPVTYYIIYNFAIGISYFTDPLPNHFHEPAIMDITMVQPVMICQFSHLSLEIKSWKYRVYIRLLEEKVANASTMKMMLPSVLLYLSREEN